MSNKKSIQLIKDIEFIKCPYCGDNSNKFKLLHWKHLKTHNKKLEDVRNEFPDLPTMTLDEYNRRLEISKIGNKASKETLSETKNIKCFYCEFEKIVPKNFPNIFVCDKCLNEGKENIDGRTKQKAKIKRVETNVEKYGKNYIEIQHKKSMKTQNKKFDGKIGFANKEIKEKIESENLKKYGSKNYMQSDKDMEDYISPALREGVREKIKQSNIDKFVKNKLNNILRYLNIELSDNQYKNCYHKHNWKCTICNHEFQQIWNDIQQGYKCPICYPINMGYSKGEKDLANFIKLNIEIIENSRNIIPPYELDIFIPSKNIAIEFNGLYWHSDGNIKDKNYHLLKTEECKKNEIRLIHIFEDEWIFKKDIVKSRLKQILGLNNNLSKIHARKCIIKEIDPKIKNYFLNKFHIQGEDKSNIKLGAFYDDELVSVMTFSKGNIAKGSKNIKDIYELSRFCSNSKYHIPGIASKLLSHFKKNYEWREIFSYADRRWSNGNVYKKIGFELESITKPNYFYTKGLERIHRFNLRKSTEEPKDITEYILRNKEGYYRIWDCGHYKFVIKNI